MKNWLLKNKLGFAGIIIGGLLGYAYYHFISCSSGTCAITSKPLNSSVYGMLMGYLSFSLFETKKKNEDKTESQNFQ
ncbi:MAG: hypothetical protein JSS94_01285 [Bacteroidetes bacterium]|nr:hypothetical protein [Bacteroidota bacterium]